MNIKNIIFDFGGVIININPQLTEEAFHKLGVKKFSDFYTLFQQNELFDKLEKGLTDELLFYDELRKITKQTFDNNSIRMAWNAMLLDIPKERIDLLLNIKKKYHTFLLSNTNIIHYNHYNQYIRNKFDINSLTELFEKAYFSFIVHMRKPDIEIFQHVLTEQNLNPEETIFIDDSIVNIRAAETIGIKGVLLETGMDLKEIVENNILKKS
jgi:putative hydrolase of the HAD superfamily